MQTLRVFQSIIFFLDVPSNFRSIEGSTISVAFSNLEISRFEVFIKCRYSPGPISGQNIMGLSMTSSIKIWFFDNKGDQISKKWSKRQKLSTAIKVTLISSHQ